MTSENLRDTHVLGQNIPPLQAHMLDGYEPDQHDFPDEQLDEFLCEYVDGTMDPAVRSAFEDLLKADPSLAAHAQCLCRTRNMLSSYGGRHACTGVEAQIRHRVAFELDRQNRSEALMVNRLGNAAFMTSLFSLILIVGVMAGLAQIESGSFVRSAGIAVVDDTDSMTIPSDHTDPHNPSRPLEWVGQQATWSGMGPSRVLPAIDMPALGWQEVRFDTTSTGGFVLVASP